MKAENSKCGIISGKISKVLVTELQVNNLLYTEQKLIKTSSVQCVSFGVVPLLSVSFLYFLAELDNNVKKAPPPLGSFFSK